MSEHPPAEGALPVMPRIRPGGRVLPVVPKTPGTMSATEADAWMLTPAAQQVVTRLGVLYQVLTHTLLEEAELLWSLQTIIGELHFFRAISPYFPHLSIGTVRNRITLWEAFRGHRDLHEWVGKNYSKALTLAQSLHENDIALLPAPDETGKSRLDQYDTMSHADLKRGLRERDAEAHKKAQAVVEEETKLLKAERDQAVSERDAALARMGGGEEAEQRQYFQRLTENVRGNLQATREHLESLHQAVAGGQRPPDSVLRALESELQTTQVTLSEVYEVFQRSVESGPT